MLIYRLYLAAFNALRCFWLGYEIAALRDVARFGRALPLLRAAKYPMILSALGFVLLPLSSLIEGSTPLSTIIFGLGLSIMAIGAALTFLFKLWSRETDRALGIPPLRPQFGSPANSMIASRLRTRYEAEQASLSRPAP